LATVRSSPTLRNASEREYEIACSTGHQSLQTLEPPILDQWPGWWIWSLHQRRASPSVKQDGVLARKIRGTISPIRCVLYGRWDHVMSCWRTSEAWLTGITRTLRKSLGVFPRQGMTRSGVCIALLRLERPTSGKGGSVWHIPTPTVSDLYTQKLASTQQKSHTNHSVTLAQWANRYPTPDGCPSEAVPGELNPDWIEWLMGLPIGWSASPPLETRSYQRWLRGFSHDQLL